MSSLTHREQYVKAECPVHGWRYRSDLGQKCPACMAEIQGTSTHLQTRYEDCVEMLIAVLDTTPGVANLIRELAYKEGYGLRYALIVGKEWMP